MSGKAAFAACTGSVFIAPDIVSLEFSWPGPAPGAGQFFLIKPRRTGVFLGRPVSVAAWNDDSGGMLRFLVALRGRGSRELAELKCGEEAELIGPLGNSWAEVNNPGDGPVALVAGGIGIAPLLAYASELEEMPRPVPYDFYAGFRSGSFSLENIKPRVLVIATEDGSLGKKGRIPDFFNPAGYSAVFACGPEPMLKAVAAICIAGKVPCFISMEKHMACGVGACLGCTVRTVNGNRRCCADGPIFSARELCFDE